MAPKFFFLFPLLPFLLSLSVPPSHTCSFWLSSPPAGMRILVNLLLDTLPMLGNVLLLCFFVFFIFGIIGVQLWAGLLRNRCFMEENFTMWVPGRRCPLPFFQGHFSFTFPAVLSSAAWLSVYRLLQMAVGWYHAERWPRLAVTGKEGRTEAAGFSLSSWSTDAWAHWDLAKAQVSIAVSSGRAQGFKMLLLLPEIVDTEIPATPSFSWTCSLFKKQQVESYGKQWCCLILPGTLLAPLRWSRDHCLDSNALLLEALEGHGEVTGKYQEQNCLWEVPRGGDRGLLWEVSCSRVSRSESTWKPKMAAWMGQKKPWVNVGAVLAKSLEPHRGRLQVSEVYSGAACRKPADHSSPPPQRQWGGKASAHHEFSNYPPREQSTSSRAQLLLLTFWL